jgi:serine/threonine protein kinase
MDNGSLEEHLYPDKDDKNVEDVCDLGLKTRLNIAIDVAHAMEYLHHDSLVHVVHCDIKPSNVLLDENMFGLVTDFGIAKLFGATSNDSHTSILALKGSMGYIAPGMNILKHYFYLYFFHNNFIWICRVNFDQVCLECRVRIG